MFIVYIWDLIVFTGLFFGALKSTDPNRPSDAEIQEILTAYNVAYIASLVFVDLFFLTSAVLAGSLIGWAVFALSAAQTANEYFEFVAINKNLSRAMMSTLLLWCLAFPFFMFSR